MSRKYSMPASAEAAPEEIHQIPVFRDTDADKFEQIQELLVGDLRRKSEARISELESRIKVLETNMLRRLESLESRISEVAFRNEEHQKKTIDEVSRGMGELSERLKNVSR